MYYMCDVCSIQSLRFPFKVGVTEGGGYTMKVFSVAYIYVYTYIRTSIQMHSIAFTLALGFYFLSVSCQCCNDE